ncbi:MAG: AI-2E family transporter, partial [Lachnospiraceae bacterium]
QTKKLFQAFLPERVRNAVLHIAGTSHGIFCAFVTGQCIEAVILGSLCAIGMLIFRFPYAGMIGALVGVTALIPVVGAFIGAGVGAFLILMTDPFQALMFLIYIVVLQQIEGNVIYPKVVGSSVGLPAMWVLAAVTVGGGIGGVLGMLFAVPTASVAYTLLREVTDRRLKKKRKDL